MATTDEHVPAEKGPTLRAIANNEALRDPSRPTLGAGGRRFESGRPDWVHVLRTPANTGEIPRKRWLRRAVVRGRLDLPRLSRRGRPEAVPTSGLVPMLYDAPSMGEGNGAPEAEAVSIRDQAETSGVVSVLHSLKEIVSIVMGLALTNSILALITDSHYTSIAQLSKLPLTTALYTIVLIVNIVRFYHGNIRHMDALYGQPARHVARSTHASLGNLGLDFIVVFLESILFAVISFYASHKSDFVLLFLILLSTDFVWNMVTIQEKSADRDVSHPRGWMMNNFMIVAALVILYFVSKGDPHHRLLLNLGVGAIALNTVVDFIISWKFYFPVFQPEEASEG
jgi:hypothetical protein